MDQLKDRFAYMRGTSKGVSFQSPMPKPTKPNIFSFKEGKDKQSNFIKIYKSNYKAKEDPEKSPNNKYKNQHQSIIQPTNNSLINHNNITSVITSSKLFKKLEGEMMEMIAQQMDEIKRLKQTDQAKSAEIAKWEKGIEVKREEIAGIEARIDDLKVEIIEEEEENYDLTNNMEENEEMQGQYDEQQGQEEGQGEGEEEQGEELNEEGEYEYESSQYNNPDDGY